MFQLIPPPSLSTQSADSPRAQPIPLRINLKSRHPPIPNPILSIHRLLERRNRKSQRAIRHLHQLIPSRHVRVMPQRTFT